MPWSAIYPVPPGPLPDDFVADAHAWVPGVLAENETLDELVATWISSSSKPLAPYTRQPRERGWLDIGGICWGPRKIMHVTLDGLGISIPAEDVGVYIDTLRQPRELCETLPSGRAIYTVPAMRISLVISSTQVIALRASLEAIAEEAEAFAAADHAKQLRSLEERNQNTVRRAVRLLGVKDGKDGSS